MLFVRQTIITFEASFRECATVFMIPLGALCTDVPFVLQQRIIRTSILIAAVAAQFIVTIDCCRSAFSGSLFCWFGVCGTVLLRDRLWLFQFWSTLLLLLCFFRYCKLSLKWWTCGHNCSSRFSFSARFVWDSICHWIGTNCFRCHNSCHYHLSKLYTRPIHTTHAWHTLPFYIPPLFLASRVLCTKRS